jgi:hypothetical protein
MWCQFQECILCGASVIPESEFQTAAMLVLIDWKLNSKSLNMALRRLV